MKADAATLEQLLDSLEDIMDPTTDMKQLYDNLNSIVSSMSNGIGSNDVNLAAKTVLEMSKHVPSKVIGEDILLFKSCLNMILNASTVGRGMDNNGSTSTGTNGGSTVLRIRVSSSSNEDGGSNRRSSEGTTSTINTADDDDEKYLIVECQDGANIPMSTGRAKSLFRNKASPLFEVRTMVRTMGGTFGADLGNLKEIDHDNTEENMSSNGGRRESSSVKTIFWFQIPLELPTTNTSAQTTTIGKTRRTSHAKSSSSNESNHMVAALPKQDPFQDAVLASPRRPRSSKGSVGGGILYGNCIRQ